MSMYISSLLSHTAVDKDSHISVDGVKLTGKDKCNGFNDLIVNVGSGRYC